MSRTDHEVSAHWSRFNMAATRTLSIRAIVVLLASFFVIGEGFRLKARFPRPHQLDFKKLAKKSVCPYCKYETRHFQQRLDHFDYTQDKTFQQRYLVSSKQWKEGGPILFYTGNEGDITWFANNTGFMWDSAKELGAMLVFAEHRYYGESLPFGEMSYKNPEHKGYLSSEQALADFATLIHHLKGTIKGAQDSPVVAIGGSYGGMLAAWFRMKYPNIVIGALAASAPILQFTGITPCENFYNIVTNDFYRDGGKPCVECIRNSWNVISNYGKTESGRDKLSKLLKLCSPLETKRNVTDLQNWLSETWVNLAMVDYPYPASFLEPLPAWPIKVTCSHLKDSTLEGDKLLTAISEAVGVYYNSSKKLKCFNTSQQAVSFLGDEGWYFQACTEMVMPLCTDGVNDMFPPSEWNFDEFAKSCQKEQGVTPREYWVQTNYGGRQIKYHSNIVFSNGLLDPWSAGGVTKNISESLVAVLIADGAHHLDLRHENDDDPASVKEARKLEKRYIFQWIAKYKDTLKKKKASKEVENETKRRLIRLRP